MTVLTLPQQHLTARLASVSPGQMAEISDAAGVAREFGMKARRGRRIQAHHYMRLCATVGIDPNTGSEVAPSMPGDIAWWFFACGVAVTRGLAKLDMRAAACAAGISATTFSQAERGKPISIESFLKLAAFVGIDPRCFIDVTQRENRKVSYDQSCTRMGFPWNVGAGSA